MKTLTLFSLAALSIGLVGSSTAAVVGYINVATPAGQKVLLGNQLHTTNDTLVTVIPVAPPGANFFKYDGTFHTYTFDDVDLAWTGDTSLAVGEGGFFVSPVNTTITFVGTVLQGRLTNTLPIGVKAIRTSMVPQSGRISADLQLPAEAGDNLYQYRGTYSTFTFDDVDLAWVPTEPTNRVGEAFFYLKAATGVSNLWIRNFTVQ